MASVNEQIVREYFEALGFFVIQPNKHQVAARHKLDAEEMDLLITRPGPAGVFNSPGEMIWGSPQLQKVQRAIISIRGWHTDRFSPAVLNKNPDLLRFAQPAVIKEARKLLGPGSITKILCLSDLSAAADSTEETLALFKKAGIDGVISFRTMMLELIGQVETARNYEKSDLLQILRILKTYDFLKDAQLELFTGRKRKTSRRT